VIPVNGDAFRGFCDHLFWHNAAPRENPNFRHGDVVFCKIDEVWRLFRALRRTRCRIVLVTGEGDKPVDAALWEQKPPQIWHWFGTNHFVEHPAATPVPLGLGNQGGTSTLEWEQIQRAGEGGRKGLLYANFRAGSNPPVRGPLLEWLEKPAQAWITRDPHGAGSGMAGYLERLRSHHFVFCPPGNGEDTHRMWEALYCGAIPVIRQSPAMREFRDLPLVEVGDLTQLTAAGLRTILENWPPPGCSRAKLDGGTWRKRILEKKEEALQRGRLSLREFLEGWRMELVRIARPTGSAQGLRAR
jgi:hypothetical protein